MPHNLRSIIGRLNEADYRVTWQRWAIVKSLVVHRDEHLSAEDLYGIIKQDYPEIGLATVYRTLELLANLGLVQKIALGDGRTRYALVDADSQHHRHLVCVRCGRVAEMDADLLARVLDVARERYGFVAEDHEVKLYGTCARCAASQATALSRTSVASTSPSRSEPSSTNSPGV